MRTIIFLILFCFNSLFADSSDIFGIYNSKLTSEDISLASLDIDSACYNPANLALIEYNGLKLTHISYVAGIAQESLVVGLIPDEFSGIGIVINYMYISDMKYNRDGYAVDKTDGYFSGKISYGYNLGGGLIAGVGCKYGVDMSETKYSLPNLLGSDIGFTFDQIILPGNAIEFYLENLISNSDDFPLSFYIGSINYLKDGFFLSLGFQYFKNQPDIFSIGVQIEAIKDLIKIKSGFKYNSSKSDFLNTLSLGLIISLENFNIEYSIVPVLGFDAMAHKFSLGIRF